MNRTTRNVSLVALFAIGGGWLGVWLNSITDQPQSLESLGALVWLVTPALAGILLRVLGGDGWKDAGFGLHLRAGWKWYLVAILVYPLIALLTLGLAAAVGAISAEGFAVQGSGAYVSAAGIAIVGSIMKKHLRRTRLAQLPHTPAGSRRSSPAA